MKRLIGCLGLAVLLAACGPTDENNTTSNNTTANNTTSNNTTSNNTNNTGGGEVSFSEDIVPIIATNCAVAGCHAAPGNGNYAIDDPANAANVQAALDGVESTAGTALVEPGEPDSSEIYLRVSGMARTQMPLGGMLDQSEIDMIRDWIAAGAPFDN